MAYIYQADIYCDDCGRSIKRRLKKMGIAPENPSDTASYDSDEYPKPVCNDEESDCPEHCGSHEDCLNAETLSDGSKIGHFFRNPITTDGEEYVKEAVKEAIDRGEKGSVALELWKPEYDYIDFGDTSEEDAE